MGLRRHRSWLKNCYPSGGRSTGHGGLACPAYNRSAVTGHLHYSTGHIPPGRHKRSDALSAARPSVADAVVGVPQAKPARRLNASQRDSSHATSSHRAAGSRVRRPRRLPWRRRPTPTWRSPSCPSSCKTARRLAVGRLDTCINYNPPMNPVKFRPDEIHNGTFVAIFVCSNLSLKIQV